MVVGKGGCSLQAALGIQKTQGEQRAYLSVERESACSGFVVVCLFLIEK